MAKGEGLVYYKWYFDKTRELEGFVKDGILTLEQAAELFFAVQAYAENGEMREMSSPYLVMIYKPLCKDADRAKQAYDDLVEKNRANGKKGVQGKAAKAAAKAAAEGAEAPPALPPAKQVKFSPPTRKQFKDAMERFLSHDWEDEDIDASDYDIDRLYDKLNENGWTLEGHAIQSRDDWEHVLYSRFCPMDTCGIDTWMFWLKLAEECPDNVPFGELRRLGEEFEENCAECIGRDSFSGVEDYDFNVNGLRTSNCAQAIAAYVKSRFEDSKEREPTA